MRGKDLADALGLVVNDRPRPLELQDGVLLTFRPPEGLDWSVAGSVVAKMMAAEQAGAEGRKRYGLASARDTAALLDPAVWEGVAEFCVAIELAARIVSDVTRQNGDERRSVEASIETFRELFRIGDNLEIFIKTVRQAGRELIAAKKE